MNESSFEISPHIQRKSIYVFLTGVVCLFLFNSAFAQNEFSNLRAKKIIPTASWQKIDSLTVASETVKVFDLQNKSINSFQFQVFNNQIKFDKSILSDSVFIKYRTLPYSLSKPLSRIDTSIISKSIDGVLLGYNPYEQTESLTDFGKLKYNGTFSRGLSFGNSQNLVLNSALNLQMAGQLTNDIEIAAAITDNSIPLQPEGNTAQLQEFDKVFVQLKRKTSTLIAGDYELRRPDRYFVNYFKKLQGATFSNATSFSDKEKEKNLKTRASVAIARGKFARNILATQEGNQGPYRLRGNENERFIIALAGTEKVYLDGELLQRGLQADYVIDYNAASITFTYKRMVNKDSRIVVEFEYTDQSYLRSLATVDLDYETKQADFYFTFYSDQDSKNSTADGELTDNQKLLLSQSGDNSPLPGIGGAVSSGIKSESEFNVLRVNYVLSDTVICGQADSVLQYTTADTAQVYTARFTQVGTGNGDYILDTEQAANGRVYRWVEPINCLPQGDYEPVLILAAPKQQQLFNAGTKLKFTKNSQLRIEGNLSRFDLNRFSEIDDGDNLGAAGFAQYKHLFQVGKKEKNQTLETKALYEIRNENFNFLNRYRPQEFTRDWNLSNAVNGRLGEDIQPQAAEQWSQANLTFKKKNWGQIDYGFGSFNRHESYDGIRHFSNFSLSRNGFDIRLNGSLLDSETGIERTRFWRPKVYLSKRFLPPPPPEGGTSGASKKSRKGTWLIGASGEREHNQRFQIATDTLNQTSFYYDVLKSFLEYEGNERFNSVLTFSKRWDYLPKRSPALASGGSEFEFSSLADDLQWSGNYKMIPANKKGNVSNLNWSMNYRRLTVEKPSQIATESGETYLGRLGYLVSLWKGAFRSTTNYQIGSGQEPKVEFNYLRVNDGEGVYQWNDYNQDDVPQQNEFETAVFQDSANFVRVSILTDEFIRSNNAQLDQNLQLEPKVLWRNAKGVKKFMSRFSGLSVWQITRRVRNVDGVSQWNPFELNIADTALVALNASFRNTLFFNRGDRIFDVQLGMNQLQNRVVITTGFEARGLEEQFLQGRWNLNRKWTFKTKIRLVGQTNDSENFNNRDYQINLWEAEPSLSWQPNTSFRTTLGVKRREAKNDLLLSTEQLQSNNFSLETTWNFSDKKRKHPTSIRLSANYAEVTFEGTANSPAGFVMLEGLRDGRNFLWNLNFDRQLFNNMRLNLSYEGRKTGESRVVHVGRAQVGVVF